MLGRVLPARATLAADYGRALAQRNEALRRVRAGGELARRGRAVDRARRRRRARSSTLLGAELVALLGAGFVGVGGSARPRRRLPSLRAPPARGLPTLEARLDRDIERGVTGIGPHLRDVGISAGERDLRSYGSQGEQRSAVLALVLAEALLLGERRGAPPLLLLDDVLSELDEVAAPSASWLRFRKAVRRW